MWNSTVPFLRDGLFLVNTRCSNGQRFQFYLEPRWPIDFEALQREVFSIGVPSDLMF